MDYCNDVDFVLLRKYIYILSGGFFFWLVCFVVIFFLIVMRVYVLF